MRHAPGFCILVLVVLLLVPLPVGADHFLVFVKDDSPDDDVTLGGPPLLPVREAEAPARVHWTLTIENPDPGADFPLDWVLDDLSAEDSAQGILPPGMRLDCATPPSATGSTTPVTIDCPVAAANDAGTPFDDPNTVRFNGVTLPAGGSVTLDFWADIRDGFEGITCNRAQARQTHDGTVSLSQDANRGPTSCISVGSGSVGNPVFSKSDGPDDDVEDSGQQGPASFPGGRVHWIIQFNNPLAFSSGGDITDDLPDNIDHDCSTFEISSDCGWIHPDPASCCDTSRDPEIDCRFDDLPSGCLVTMEIWGTIQEDPGPTPPCNVAELRADNGQGSQSNGGDPFCIFLGGADTAVTAEKSVADDNGGDLEPGDVLTWTVDVINRGGFPATTNMTDPLQPYLDLVPGSLVPFDGAACQENDTDGDTRVDEIACTGVGVAPGETNTLTFQTVVRCEGLDPEVGACNQAAFVIPLPPFQLLSHPPGTTNPQATCLPVTIPFAVTADKSATFDDADGNGVLSPGEPVVYAVAVTNTGSRDLDNVTLSDPVPGLVTYQTGSIALDGAGQTDALGDDDGEFDAGTVRANRTFLPVGATTELTFRVDTPAQAQDFTSFCNTATIESDQGRTCGLVDRSNDLCLALERPADLDLVKSAVDENGGDLQPGDLVTYRLELTNTGARRGEDLEIRDPIPVGTTYVPGSLTVGGFPVTDAPGDDAGEADGTGVTGRSTILGAGAVLELTFQVTVDNLTPGTEIRNTGTASSLNPLRDTVSNEVVLVVGTPVEPEFELSVTKEAFTLGGDPLNEVLPGDPVEYRVEVCNLASSPDPAPTVVLRDPVPGRTTYTPDSLVLDGTAKTDATGDDEAERDAGDVVARLGDLAPGTCAELRFRVTVDAGAQPGDLITNLAEAAAMDGTGAPVQGSVILGVVAEDLVFLLRGEGLTTDVDPADSCPVAAEQLPRLDPVADLCEPFPCEELTPDRAWRITEGGGEILVFYEVAGVPCSDILRLFKEPGSGTYRAELP